MVNRVDLGTMIFKELWHFEIIKVRSRKFTIKGEVPRPYLIREFNLASNELGSNFSSTKKFFTSSLALYLVASRWLESG